MTERAKIYTKGGDHGETSLLGGKRVPKSHERVEAYGTIDELNSFIGLLRDQTIGDHYLEVLLNIQDNLFVAEAWVAKDPGAHAEGLPQMNEDQISLLEQEIDIMTSELPPLSSFIIPGGHPVASVCHIARTVCRRAERTVIRLGQKQPVDQIIIRYLNRLSDYLFVLARKTGQDAGAKEIRWPRKD
jgi:cob(I)alamin adenosyltransferase